MNSKRSVCVHCDSSHIANREEYEIQSKSTQALTSIFKFHYLPAFDLLDKNVDKDPLEADLFESWTLCRRCRQMLAGLQQLYNNFIHVGKVESEIVQKMKQLDEIIESHRRKEIECDLVVSLIKEEEEEENSPTSFEENVSLEPPTKKSKSLIPTGPQPRISLTRLPEQPVKIQPVLFEKEKMYSVNDDDIQQEIETTSCKSEKEDDDFSENDDDGTNSPWQGSDDDESSTSETSEKDSESVTNSSRKFKTSQKQIKKKLSVKNPLPVKQKTGKCAEVKPMDFEYYIAKRTAFANPCWYCEMKDFSSPAECVEHTRREHLHKFRNPASSKICDRCAKITVTDRGFQRHKSRCDQIPSGVLLPKKFSCSICSKTFAIERRLREHLIRHNSDRPYACDLCPYRAKEKCVLSVHKERNHSASQSQVQCGECKRVCKNALALKVHQQSMHTPEGYAKYKKRQRARNIQLKEERQAKAVPPVTLCSDCNVDFYSRLAYMNHRRTVHNDNMGFSYCCEMCGKSFMNEPKLKVHIATHNDERSVFCDQCGKNFKSNKSLAQHVQNTHSEEGRLKYNQRTREKNQRKKLLLRQLAALQENGRDTSNSK